MTLNLGRLLIDKSQNQDILSNPRNIDPLTCKSEGTNEGTNGKGWPQRWDRKTTR